MSKHTLGPWRVVPLAGVYNGRLSVQNSAGRTIVDVLLEPEDEQEDEANARLIAAAPDMLAALKEGDSELLGGFSPNTRIRTVLRRAIAKAEGQNDS